MEKNLKKRLEKGKNRLLRIEKQAKCDFRQDKTVKTALR